LFLFFYVAIVSGLEFEWDGLGWYGMVLDGIIIRKSLSILFKNPMKIEQNPISFDDPLPPHPPPAPPLKLALTAQNYGGNFRISSGPGKPKLTYHFKKNDRGEGG
jgi:hypothetical protein